MRKIQIQTCKACDNRRYPVSQLPLCVVEPIREDAAEFLGLPPRLQRCEDIREGPNCANFVPRRPWWKRLLGVK